MALHKKTTTTVTDPRLANLPTLEEETVKGKNGAKDRTVCKLGLDSTDHRIRKELQERLEEVQTWMIDELRDVLGIEDECPAEHYKIPFLIDIARKYCQFGSLSLKQAQMFQRVYVLGEEEEDITAKLPTRSKRPTR